jgi:phosphopantetheinyl transferase (holo-ACP synthase)
MLTYFLTQNLPETEKPEWSELVEKELGEKVHPGRALGYCLARVALRLCLKEKNLSLPISEMRLQSYNALSGVTSLTISLSHTPLWGAAVVGEVSEFQSVGIDIEPKSRVVKPTIIERVSHPADAVMESIQLWSLKEASFKALMNTQKFSVPQDFSDIQIKSNGKWEHSVSGTVGEWSVFEEQELIVALAWIRI